MESVVAGATPQKVPASRCKLRTLVVDDSLTILHAICSLLEHHEVVEVVGRAESGTETIDAVLTLRPELVLIDADMPGMSGLRASLLLAQIAPEIKVVLMSMDATPQFRSACAGCGAYGVIYKPKFLSELTQLLESGLPVPQRPLAKQRRKTAHAVVMRSL